MRRLVFSLGVSLDGFIAGPDGDFGWAAPDAELHRFHNEQARGFGAQLMGRHLYETMRAWETMGSDPDDPPEIVEFARVWNATPRYVFSSTLERAEGGVELVRGDAVEAVARMKAEPGEGDLGVGGAGLGGSLLRAGLVDELCLFVNPVVVGGGTRFFPALDEPLGLELTETRTFGSRVVYLRYSATTSR